MPALGLAGLLLALTAGPVAASFESAVADYEKGAYPAAHSEFEALANAGDERAKPYLERIREKLGDRQQAGDSITSILGDTITSIFSGSTTSSDRPESEANSLDTGSFATARTPRHKGPSGSESEANSPDTGSFATARTPRQEGPSGSDWEPWSPFDQSTEPPPVSGIVIPYHRSAWLALFHLPGDATVIGLQYVARLFDFDDLYWDLQFIAHYGSKIALGMLAAFWWLIIMKVTYSLFRIVRGLARAMVSPLTDEAR